MLRKSPYLQCSTGWRKPLAKRFRAPPPRVAVASSEKSLVGRARLASRSALAVLGLIAYLALMTVILAANVVSGIVSDGRGKTVTPRAVRLDDLLESRLANHLSNEWLRSSHSPDSITIGILDSRDINAASVGGGRFILWRGLGRLPDRALDGVMAHEIAHDDLKHAQRTSEVEDVTDWFGSVLAIFTDGDPETSATLKRWSGNLVIPKYDRAQELEADRYGTAILEMAGYSSGRQQMRLTLVDIRACVGNEASGFFSDHPALSDRIAALDR